MSDEGSNAEGDVGRYLKAPTPETGFRHAAAAASYVVENMEIQYSPDPDQAYGFPEEAPPPLAAAAATRVDDSFQGMFHGDPGSQPPYDQFMMNDGEDELAAIFRGTHMRPVEEEDLGNASGGATVEPDMRPVEEEDPGLFVPFVRGQLDCTNCRTVWEALHESANHKLYVAVHGGTGLGNFHHLITDRMQIGAADGQTTSSEQMYLDLQQRTQDWVQSFIANCEEALRNDSSGQLKDSRSTFCTADCTDTSTPPVNNNAHMELEIDMLIKILNTPATNDEAVAVSSTNLENMLRISSSSLKQLCRKHGSHRWPAHRNNALNKKIEKLEQAARRNVGTRGLLEIKEKVDKLHESIMKRIRENEMKKGAGSSGSK